MYLWYKIVNKELLELCAVLINLCSSLRDIWGRVLVMVALGKRECWMQLGISCLEELVPHFYCSIMFEQPWWLGNCSLPLKDGVELIEEDKWWYTHSIQAFPKLSPCLANLSKESSAGPYFLLLCGAGPCHFKEFNWALWDLAVCKGEGFLNR